MRLEISQNVLNINFYVLIWTKSEYLNVIKVDFTIHIPPQLQLTTAPQGEVFKSHTKLDKRSNVEENRIRFLV